jgi:hypothetical protein
MRHMVQRVWAAAGRLIAAQRPELEIESGKVGRDLDRAEEQLEPFRAFEDASMDARRRVRRASTP